MVVRGLCHGEGVSIGSREKSERWWWSGIAVLLFTLTRLRDTKTAGRQVAAPGLRQTRLWQCGERSRGSLVLDSPGQQTHEQTANTTILHTPSGVYHSFRIDAGHGVVQTLLLLVAYTHVKSMNTLHHHRQHESSKLTQGCSKLVAINLSNYTSSLASISKHGE